MAEVRTEIMQKNKKRLYFRRFWVKEPRQIRKRFRTKSDSYLYRSTRRQLTPSWRETIATPDGQSNSLHRHLYRGLGVHRILGYPKYQ